MSSIFNINRARITFAKLNDTINGAIASPVYITATTGIPSQSIPLVANGTTFSE